MYVSMLFLFLDGLQFTIHSSAILTESKLSQSWAKYFHIMKYNKFNKLEVSGKNKISSFVLLPRGHCCQQFATLIQALYVPMFVNSFVVAIPTAQQTPLWKEIRTERQWKEAAATGANDPSRV